MAGDVVVKIGGIEQLNAALRALPDKLRKRVMLKALRKAARVVLVEARDHVPVLKGPAKYRTPGLVKKRITMRTSKESRKAGNVGVFVNVKPAEKAKYASETVRVGRVKFKTKRLVRASQAGAKSPNDPFYWRFVEFGTRKMKAQPFIKPAGDRLEAALAVFEQSALAGIAELNGEGK